MSKDTGNIVFYCKDCEQIVDVSRCGKKYVYKCKKCGTKNVAFGTKKSIYSFFHVKEDAEEREDTKEKKSKKEDKEKKENKVVKK